MINIYVYLGTDDVINNKKINYQLLMFVKVNSKIILSDLSKINLFFFKPRLAT
jgi:hypothetical protein